MTFYMYYQKWVIYYINYSIMLCKII